MGFLENILNSIRQYEAERTDPPKLNDHPLAPTVVVGGTPANDRHYKVQNIGPGCWYTIHLCAARGDHDTLSGLVKVLMDSFTCVKCRAHIIEHLAENPIPLIKGSGLTRQKVRLALFNWTFVFHNAVNARIGKPVLSKDEGSSRFNELTTVADAEGAYYISTGKCDGGCDGIASDVKTSTPEKQIPSEYPKDSVGSVKFAKY